jgi:hypothetical protein
MPRDERDGGRACGHRPRQGASSPAAAGALAPPELSEIERELDEPGPELSVEGRPRPSSRGPFDELRLGLGRRGSSGHSGFPAT